MSADGVKSTVSNFSNTVNANLSKAGNDINSTLSNAGNRFNQNTSDAGNTFNRDVVPGVVGAGLGFLTGGVTGAIVGGIAGVGQAETANNQKKDMQEQAVKDQQGLDNAQALAKYTSVVNTIAGFSKQRTMAPGQQQTILSLAGQGQSGMLLTPKVG